MRRGAAGLGGLALLIAALVVTGCDRPERPADAPASDAEKNAIVQEKSRGPVSVTLRVEPKEPTFAERIRYTLRVTAPEGVEVTMPRVGEDVGSMGEQLDPSKFIVRDYSTPPPSTEPDGTTRHEHSYILEVVTSGTYRVPPTTISFVDRRPPRPTGPLPEDGGEAPAPPPPPADGEEKVFRILTDQIELTVKGLADATALDGLAGIEGPVEPPRLPPSLKWPLIGAGALVGLALLALLLAKLKKTVARPPPPVPPEDLAYRELEWLVAQGFTDRDEYDEFYFHLSRIVREYIERRFGLRAPEQTTEEFLASLASSDALSETHKALLERFLEQADLVKFAKVKPSPDEVTASFDAAKSFIAETRRGEPTPGSTTGNDREATHGAR